MTTVGTCTRRGLAMCITHDAHPAALPVTREETGAQSGEQDENSKSSSRPAGAGLPERPPHSVGYSGLPAPTRTRPSWEDCALGTGWGGGGGWQRGLGFY